MRKKVRGKVASLRECEVEGMK
ncbi:uncharacterized protein G2W53_024512 [Senna tora]|uniref:Uncharacterized protein n=1 Tax=Senna tora TaxID=362788 RepID=A0A834TBQ2_9FABA|nr:uncharacterized protein G2W53_024512 [Senna tora]